MPKSNFVCIDSKHLKIIKSEDYNYFFNKRNGFMARWGKNKEDDPVMAPFPEILDIEVSTICNNGCPFCYKSNTAIGKNMSLDTFKQIMDKFKVNDFYPLSQIAYGSDSSGTSNPELFDMMRYARSIGIIPNITIADISDSTADVLADVCGAVAVSRYKDKNKCYDSVKKLVDRGLKYVNIHICLSVENLDMVYETLQDFNTDDRLKGVFCIVLLSLKKKGRGINHSSVSQEQFNDVVNFAFNNKVPFGFDSCSYSKFINSIKNHPEKVQMEQMAEPCESFGLFSSYINVDGRYFPCSFCDGVNEDWKDGIDVLSCGSFSEIWHNPLVEKYRQKSLSCNRECLVYSI